jgi:hypothetical protein
MATINITSTGATVIDVLATITVTNTGQASNIPWGNITGDITDQTDLIDELDLKVPYTGATSDVNLGTFDIESTQARVDSIQLDTTATPITNAEGLIQWNATENTVDVGLEGGQVTGQLFEEMYIRGVNKTGSQLLEGQVVYSDSRTGNKPNFKLARADSHTTAGVLGVLTMNIDNNGSGRATTFGLVRQIKTNYTGNGDWGTTWQAGDTLWLSKTVAGQLTNVEPTVPHHSDTIGTVALVGGAGIGEIFININHHKRLDDLADVNGTALTTTGQIASYNATTGYHDFDKNINDYLVKNASITGATKTKITYDSKGLVTAGADATTADIADSLNKRYVTDSDLTKLSNTSGVNTGDETNGTIISKIGYTPENVANKATTMTGNTASNIVYLTAKAVFDWATGLFVDLVSNQTIAGNKTFSGTPEVQNSYPAVQLNTTGDTGIGGFIFRRNGLARWLLGTQGSESGANAGNDVIFNAYTDAGAYLWNAFTFGRGNKNITLSDGRVAINGTTGNITAPNLSGTNTGDQTSIVGITGTTAQFNTALTDNDFATLAGSETLTNKTITSPKINQVNDTNNNPLVTYTTIASAVNYLDVRNNRTAFSPSITATGTDTSISINITPKGTGRILDRGVIVPNISSSDTLTNKRIVLSAGTTTAGTAPLKLTTQTSPLTVAEQGTFELVGNSLQFTQLAKRRGVAMSQDVRITSTTVGNTTTESGALITAEHEANYWEVGKCEEIVLRGIVQQTTTGGGVLQMRIKYAGVTLQTTSTVSATIAAGTPFKLEVTTTCRSTGATGTLQVNTLFSIDGVTYVPDASTLATINTTTVQDTTVTAQWTVANASNTITVAQGRVLCIEPSR